VCSSDLHVFSYSEVFDGNRAFLQTFVKKNIDPNDPGRIGGNRDALDFAQYFALRDNLTGNGFANDWRNVIGAGMDVFDDGLHNGTAGVMFVQSHDEFAPHLGNVAYAYMLMLPGNAIVYMNGKEFGDNRDFPKDGRGDALGGVFGDTLETLVDIRNTHGRGNYAERWVEKELYAFERVSSSITLLSNRLDGGFDSRTLQNVGFAPGTPLVEITGNAANPFIDPFNDIAEVVVVNAEKVILTGKKEDDKLYRRHSGYPGGLKETTARKLRQDHPERLVEFAVVGMLPKNKLGKQLAKRLRVYAGPEHPHEAQGPKQPAASA